MGISIGCQARMLVIRVLGNAPASNRRMWPAAVAPTGPARLACSLATAGNAQCTNQRLVSTWHMHTHHYAAKQLDQAPAPGLAVLPDNLHIGGMQWVTSADAAGKHQYGQKGEGNGSCMPRPTQAVCRMDRIGGRPGARRGHPARARQWASP